MLTPEGVGEVVSEFGSITREGEQVTAAERCLADSMHGTPLAGADPFGDGFGGLHATDGNLPGQHVSGLRDPYDTNGRYGGEHYLRAGHDPDKDRLLADQDRLALNEAWDELTGADIDAPFHPGGIFGSVASSQDVARYRADLEADDAFARSWGEYAGDGRGISSFYSPETNAYSFYPWKR